MSDIQATGNRAAEIADAWTNALEKSPERATEVAGELIANSGKYFLPAAMTAGGGWVMTKAGENAVNAFLGENVPGFKASTSNTDRVAGTMVYGLAAAAGAAMVAKGAVDIVKLAAEDIRKD